MSDLQHHPAAVDIGHLKAHRLRGAQARGIGRGERHPCLQRRHGFQKAHHLIGAQDRRQLARRARINNPLGDLGAVQSHAVEEPQRANDLVQGRPGDPLRNQMHLERADILKPQPVRRAAEITAELRHRMQIGSLGGRRQVAERHVVDHAATKGAHRLGLRHRELLLGWVASTPKPSQQELQLTHPEELPRQRVRSIPCESAPMAVGISWHCLLSGAQRTFDFRSI